MSRRSGVAAGAILALGGAVVVAGTVFGGDERVLGSGDASVPGREQVRSVRVGCPDVGAVEGRTTWVSAAGVPGVEGRTGDGSLDVTGGANPLAITNLGGSGTLDQFTGNLAQVRAEGALAPGALSARVSTDADGEGRGIASAPCSEPSSDLWLVGGGASEGQRDALVLANPTDTDAVADVVVYGPDGRLDTTATRGIAVKRGETTELRLDSVAPSVDVLALHVKTKVGLVSATVLDDRMVGLVPSGVDLIPAVGRPAKELVIPGIPSGSGTRELLLFAPGEPGTAKVRAFTSAGVVATPYSPGTRLVKDGVVRVGLTGMLAGRSSAVEVKSNVPVVAALSATSDVTDGGSDLLWQGPAPALSGTGAVTGLRSRWSTQVLLTATDGDVRARISVLPEVLTGSELVPVGEQNGEVTVPEGRTVEVNVPAPDSAAYTVVIERLDGVGLYAAHVQSDRSGTVTGYGVVDVSGWVTLPAVGPEYGRG